MGVSPRPGTPGGSGRGGLDHESGGSARTGNGNDTP